MRFYLRKRRAAPAVIIVALIDVLIVLLIFLMVTTTFKQQRALKFARPASTPALMTWAIAEAPLFVSVDTEGNLRVGGECLPVTSVGLLR